MKNNCFKFILYCKTNLGYLFIFLFFIIFGNAKVSGQLLQQDFNSSTTVDTFDNLVPDNGQFDTLKTFGSANITIDTVTSNKLRFVRSTGAGCYVRITDFSPVPTSLIYQFNLTVSSNSATQTMAALWQIGSGFTDSVAAEPNARVHSQIGLNFSSTPGEFSLRDSSGHTNSGSYSGMQKITWVVNNSNGSLTYTATDSSNETVAKDKADVWIGNTREFNDISATSASKSLINIKFLFEAGNDTVDIDSILIDPIPAVPPTTAATNITSNGFTANWLTINDVTGYRIDVALDSGFTNMVIGYKNLYVASQAASFLNITGLSANTPYYYRIRGANQYTLGEFAGGNSLTQTLTTLNCTPPLDPTGTITIAANPACGSTTLSYPAGSGNIKYYWQTAPTGTSTADTTNGSPNYLINTSGSYYVRALDTITSCWSNGALSSGNIVINSLPVATITEFDNSGLSNDNLICYGDTATLIASGGTSYLWSNGATNDTIFVSPAVSTLHTVTITDQNGCNSTASKEVTVHAVLNASVSGTDTVCLNAGGSSPVTFTGFNGTKPYTFFYNINGGLLADTTTNITDSSITVFASTGTSGNFVYILTKVSDSNLCSQPITDVATLNVNPLPIATISGISNVCLNGPKPLINFAGHSGVQPYKFYYHINNGPAKNITTAGSNIAIDSANTDTAGIFVYSIDSVSDANGCINVMADSAIITVSSTVPVSIQEFDVSGTPNDGRICLGDSATLLASFPSSAGAVYLWSTAATTQSITVAPNADSAYIVSVTSGNCTSTDSFTIVVNALPTASISITGNDTVCQHQIDSIRFTGHFGNKPYTFLYKINGAMMPAIQTNFNSASIKIPIKTDSAGTFVYKLISVSDDNGCSQSDTDSIIIKVNALPDPHLTEIDSSGLAPNDNKICTSDKVTLIADGGIIYLWNTLPVDTNDTLIQFPASSATYTVTVTDTNNCSATDSLQITVVPLPSAVITETDNSGAIPDDGIICIGDAVTLYAPIGGVAYNWSTGETTSLITVIPTSDSIFTVTVTNADSCKSSGSKQILVKPIPVSTISETDNSGAGIDDSTICIGNSSTLTVPIIIGGKYSWSTGDTTNTIIVWPSYDSTFTVTVINSDSCQSTGTKKIFVKPLPVAGITENDNSGIIPDDRTICLGDSAALSATGGVSYFWSTGETTQTIFVAPLNDTTIYTVTVANSDSCQSTISDTIFVKLRPNITINESDSSGAFIDDGLICYGDTARLIAAPFNSNFTYLWSNGEINNTIFVSPANTTAYNVTVTNANGCDSTFSRLITVSPKLAASISFTNFIDSISTCQYDPQPAIIIKGYNGTLNYHFIYNINAGPIISDSTNGSDSLLISASTLLPGSFVYSLISISDLNQCSQTITDSAIKIIVKPAPAKPLFFSDLISNSDTLCNGSTNINFNILNPSDTITYQWSVTPSVSAAIGNISNPNTVISFNGAGTLLISDTATTGLGCKDASSMMVYISSNDSIDERKIFLKNPGNLLIYPDNSMVADSGYQWGYDIIDTIIGIDTILGPPNKIPGQVYQVFVPSTQFIKNDSLNIHDYCYWVLLKNRECVSKVYYNGPYKNNRLQAETMHDNTVGINVFPNPTAGDIGIRLYGNIYGNIDLKVYDLLSQMVYRNNFEKKQFETIYHIKLDKIPDGIYLVELTSRDHQKLTSRIIIYR